jgi:hypothetical protein
MTSNDEETKSLIRRRRAEALAAPALSGRWLMATLAAALADGKLKMQ